MQLGRPRGACKALRLEQVSVARLLFGLLHQRFTGVLQVDQPAPSGHRTLWFQGGMPLFTDWVSDEHSLAEVLVSEGLVTSEQLSVARVAAGEHTDDIGSMLVEQGVLEAAHLTQAIRRQCARKLLELFDLEAGEVLMTPGEYEVPAGLTGINVLKLIWAGVSAHYATGRIAAEMGAEFGGPLQLTPSAGRYLAHFHFPPDADRLLAGLGPGATIDELARLPGSTEQLAAQIVFTLWACKMLRVGVAARGLSETADASRAGSAGTAKPVGPPRRPTPSLEQLRAVARPGLKDDARSAPSTVAVQAPSVSPVAEAFDGSNGRSDAGDRGTGIATPTRRTPSGPSPAAAPASSPSAESNPADAEFDEKTFVRDLGVIEERIAANKDAFALLGLGLDAGKRDVRHAFGQLSRRFHPDALQARGLGHLQARVSQVFAALSEAQSLLSDPDAREKLRQSIEQGGSGGPGDATSMAQAAFESDMIAREADRFLAAGRFDRALEAITRALALTPDEPDLRAVDLWCRYQLSARDRNTATITQTALTSLVKATPKLARAHYFLGLVLRDTGATDAAIDALSKAIRLDPRMIDAERQARALRLAKTAPPKGASGKGGLFRGRR